MKNIFFTLALLISLSTFGQQIESFKKKTDSNRQERTLILDILRASLYQDYKQEFEFVVNKLNVSSQYAWFQGTAVRNDRRKVRTKNGNCCDVDALLKKNYGKWYIVELQAFSDNRDFIYEIWEDYNVPRELF